jgi:hypothetical protein
VYRSISLVVGADSYAAATLGVESTVIDARAIHVYGDPPVAMVYSPGIGCAHSFSGGGGDRTIYGFSGTRWSIVWNGYARVRLCHCGLFGDR